MEPNFERGQTVRLKSGGPPMTVVYLPGEEPDGQRLQPECFYCVWFDRGLSLCGGVFHAAAIERSKTERELIDRLEEGLRDSTGPLQVIRDHPYYHVG